MSKIQGTKYFNYNRKSTTDERQVLSLGSQEENMKKIAEQRELQVKATFNESKSAKEPNKRPVFVEMIARIKDGEANGIICWELSRLARNPDEAGLLIGMLQRGEIRHIMTYGKDYYSDDNSVISFVEFGIANQFSRDLSKNVKRGVDKKAAMGWRPNRAPLGYLNSKTKLKGEQDIVIDPVRFGMVRQIFQTMLTGNYTIPKLLPLINEEWNLRLPATKTSLERKMHLSELHRILTNPFYYGWFEWPQGSGNWLQGKHQPMISEAEFDRVQFLLGRDGRPRPKTHKFAFTGLLKCPCGASITAEEKFKKQKNGNIHQYTYYRCTKKINKLCTEKSIEVKVLDKQVDEILSSLTISEKFQNWALKYLHEVRKGEAQTREQSIASKHKEYEKITQRLDNLVLQYIDPSNKDGRILSEEEYLPIRSALLKDKADLHSELNVKDKEINDWIELSERTFNFARYARTWFAQGDLDTKRSIFSSLGSDLILKDRKVALNIRKPFNFIFEGLSNAKNELDRLEPIGNGVGIDQLERFASQFPTLSG